MRPYAWPGYGWRRQETERADAPSARPFLSREIVASLMRQLPPPISLRTSPATTHYHYL